MNRIVRHASDRRNSILKSLETGPDGRFTRHGAKVIAEAWCATPAVCTVSHYCRTSVYAFPGCHLTSSATDVLEVIYETRSFRAVVISDLPAYFKRGRTKFPHYGMDVSLRDGIDRAYEKKRGRRPQSSRAFFLLIEEYEKVPFTTLENGECFEIDQCLDGKQLIEGGVEGERALAAVRNSDGAWPDFSPSMHGVNAMLTAVKAEQKVTHHIDQLYTCSCFATDDGRAVYPLSPRMSIAYGGARISSPVDVAALSRIIANVRSIHDGLRRDAQVDPQISELIDAVLLEKKPDERYFRLWYLRLWQAIADAKRLLGVPDLERETAIIAGDFAPAELKDYRHKIAHWWTGKVDFTYVTGMQQTVLELLRNKYRGTGSP